MTEKRGQGCLALPLAGLIFVGMIAATIAYVKSFDDGSRASPLGIVCIITVGCVLFLGALALGAVEWETKRRVSTGVGAPPDPPSVDSRAVTVEGRRGEVVARQLRLALEDGSTLLVDGHTSGFVAVAADGDRVEIPAGPVRLELSSRRARRAWFWTVRAWLAAAGLPRVLFDYHRAWLVELRGGDAVVLIADTVAEGSEAGYRVAADVRRSTRGVPTVRA